MAPDDPRHTTRRSAAALPGSARPRSAGTVHPRFRDLTLALSRGLSSSPALGLALRALALEANTLLGARRTTVWLHQRRTYDLTPAASSDDGPAAAAGPVRTDDPEAPPARGLWLDYPALVAAGDAPVLLAPLRGLRRALGTLVVEGPFAEPGDGGELVELAHELGRELSAALENIQLLDEVVRQRRLLENTFDSLVELVVVTDPGFRIVQVNDAFLARTRAAREDLLERPLDELIGPAMAAWLAEPPVAERHGQEPDGARTARFEDERLGGTFDVTMTSLAHAGGPPAGHVVVARDVTRQTQLETEREALRARLTQSEKLAALGQFVAGIAHEMNNPLQGVLGHLELMIDTNQAARPLRRELRRIYQDADRAAKIVRNLMVFTGSRRMTRRRLRPHRILSRALASRAAALSRGGIEVVRDESPDVPVVLGDPLLLHQALLNILINAEHAIASTGRGGRITITVRPVNPLAGAVITIRDTGPGIPADVLPRVFDPFFTTKEVGQGTGLGLAITYGIIQEHGGAIHAANAAGGGAAITVELPAAS